MNAVTRVFEDKPASRDKVPLLIGLMGPSGSGKSFSALRLATGIQQVSGGDIFVIDTEASRAKHYADRFKFRHLDFKAPFGPLDYLAAINHCVGKGAGVIIVDSMSHEHEGPGGVLEQHEQELDRMAGQDYGKRAAMNLIAWAKPKAARRHLIGALLQVNANFVFCFRAKEKVKPVKRNGKSEIENQGWMPIAGEEFIYEQTANMLLLPGSGGVPTWVSDQPGEKAMMKIPAQFKGIIDRAGQELTEDIGAKLAQWAQGVPPVQRAPDPATIELARTAARGGSDVFKTWWTGANAEERADALTVMDDIKAIRNAADAEQAQREGDEQDAAA